MSTEHWRSFQKQQQQHQSMRHSEMMPINIEEVERQRRRHDSICSVKSLFCCLSVLVGKHSYTKSSLSKKRKKRQTQHHVVRSFEDDDSFGHNFDDDEQMIT